MKLTILGAAKEVTGSMYVLEVGDKKVLVDCGMHQGESEDDNYKPFPVDATSIDALLLTHAHIDHSGRIPLLVREGFKGKVYATLPTVELTEILWRDSVRLMAEDARWRSRKNERKGLPPVEPLYEENDVNAAIGLFLPVAYDDKVEVVPGLTARFRDAGHIIGSSVIEAFLTEGDQQVKVVFSGDLGPMKTVMEREPVEIDDADYVLIESTYGDRDHKNAQETRKEFRELMSKLVEEKGKIFIPTFVVDRAQRVMYELSLLRDQGIGVDTPVFFDSPMGVKVTEIYREHLDMMSSEIQAYRRSGKDPFSDGVTFVSEPEQSKALNEKGHGIYMAGSGMVNGGRMTHHLKNNLYKPENHVVFVGYQAFGTVGRKIVDGLPFVKINGEDVAVKASIHTLGGFSAHADRTDLLTWAEHFRPSMPQFVVIHGEEHSSKALCETLKERGFDALVPTLGQQFELVPRNEGQRLQQAQMTRDKLEVLERKNVAQQVVDPLQLAKGEDVGSHTQKSNKPKLSKKELAYQRQIDRLVKLIEELRGLDGEKSTVRLLGAVETLLESAKDYTHQNRDH